MSFPPSVPVKGILDFIHAVSFLERFERCQEVHPTLGSPIIQRSKELCRAKKTALKALKSLFQFSDDTVLSELDRHLRCLLVSPRINSPIPCYPICPTLNDTVWASHVLDDFLFIGPGSEFMQLKLGHPNAANPAMHAHRHSIINQFIERLNIRFILNVSKELIPGLQTDGEREYSFAFSVGHPVTCVKTEDLTGIETDDPTAQDLQSFLGVMIPMDDSEEYSTEFDRLIQVAAFALELAWRRYVFASIQFPSQPPPRVYLHCFGGLNRSTYTAVYWLVKYHGISPDQAWMNVYERRRPQCKEERPPLNGVVNGKLTGKNQWRDALRRVPVPEIVWPQLQLSQRISEPLFALNVSSNIINTAEASTRAILNKMHTEPQESSIKFGFTDLLTRLLCQPHPVFEPAKHSCHQLKDADHQRSAQSLSTWSPVAHSAIAFQVVDSRHLRDSHSTAESKSKLLNTASGSIGQESKRIVDEAVEPICQSSKLVEEQYHYLKLSGLRSSVSDDDVFNHFQRFFPIRDRIFAIKSSNSQYQLTFIGFNSFYDASRAKMELDSLKKPLTVCNCCPCHAEEIVPQRRVESIRHKNCSLQDMASVENFAAAQKMGCDDRSDTCDATIQTQRNAGSRGARACLYFARGYCFKGDKCPFSHDQSAKETEVRPSTSHNLQENGSLVHKRGVHDSHSFTREVECRRYVKFLNLHHKCSKQDIIAFFSWNFPRVSLSESDIIIDIIPNDLGRAYCSLSIDDECFDTLLRGRHMMGSHRIELLKSSKETFAEVAATKGKTSSAIFKIADHAATQPKLSNAAPSIPSLASTCAVSSNSCATVGAVSEQAVLKLRGLPYSVTEKDIVTFFEGYDLVPGSVKFGSSVDGFMGWASFSSLAEARRVIRDKHGKYIGKRFVDIFLDRSSADSSTHQSSEQSGHSFRHDSSSSSSSSSSSVLHECITNPVQLVRTPRAILSCDQSSLTTYRADKRGRDCETSRSDTNIQDITADTNSGSGILKPAWGNPTNVLFFKNLPESCSAKDFNSHFQNLKGFKVARDSKILNRPVIFAEFTDVSSSKEAILAMQGKVLFHHSNQGLDIEFAKSGKRESAIEPKCAKTIDIRSGILSAEFGKQTIEEANDLDGQFSKKHRHDMCDKQPLSKFDCGFRKIVIHDDSSALNNSSTNRSVSENPARSLSGSSGQQVSQDASFPYRSPSGQEVRVWCRFGRNCKSGSHCRFGHEIIVQTSAQNLTRNVDLREIIDSKSS
jgi:RNA recognition motif-containing protein